MKSFWAERAWLGRPAERVLVEVEGERIAAVRENAEPPAAAARLPGLLLPGLANAHSHAFHRALRGAAEGRGPSFWDWRQAMYRVAATLDPDRYARLARAVYAEMALAGITAVGEFHYLHHVPRGRPYADPNEMGRVLIHAARGAGVRLTLLDTCYLRGGFVEPLEGAQVRFGDGDAGRWAERVAHLQDDANTRIGAAIHSVRAVDPESMALVAGWARDRQLPLHLHLLERKEEYVESRSRLGRTPLELVDGAGVLGERTTAVHVTHLGARPFRRLVDSGTSACICRTTERDLADGHVQGLAQWRTTAKLCFGTDSHAVVDMFEEARALELDQRTRTGGRGTFTPEQLLEAATAGGYAALGWDGGRLEAGALADLVAVDLSSVRTASAPGVEAATVIFAAGAADVTDVVVGGREIVRERRHVAVADPGRELREAIAAL